MISKVEGISGAGYRGFDIRVPHPVRCFGAVIHHTQPSGMT